MKTTMKMTTSRKLSNDYELSSAVKLDNQNAFDFKEKLVQNLQSHVTFSNGSFIWNPNQNSLMMILQTDNFSPGAVTGRKTSP